MRIRSVMFSVSSCPVNPGQENGRPDHDEPDHETRPGEERLGQPLEPGEEAIGVEKMKPHEQGASQVLLPAGGSLLLKALQNLRRVRHHVRLKSIHGVKLAEKANHLLLSGRLFSKAVSCCVPDLLNRSLSVHEADNLVGGRRESAEASGGVILQHIPQLAPVVVPVDFHVAPQPGL